MLSMDPITAAILAGLASGATKVGERSLTDAYSLLRRLIQRKYGSNSDLDRAVQSVEANPNSASRRNVLEESIGIAGATRDRELLEAADRVLRQVDSLPQGRQLIQTIQAGRWVVAGDINVGPGGAFLAGDYHSTISVDEFSSKTNFGCAFKTIGIAIALAGFAWAAYSMVEWISAMPDLGDTPSWEQDPLGEVEFPPGGFVEGAALFFVGLVFTIIAKLIDETLSRRR
jgi:hypothetical protein